MMRQISSSRVSSRNHDQKIYLKIFHKVKNLPYLLVMYESDLRKSGMVAIILYGVNSLRLSISFILFNKCVRKRIEILFNNDVIC